MTAYYNEFDKDKAAWLRELIKQNVVAPGEVDERSITEVQPEDLRGFTQCHFFAGIGVWSYALRLAGWPDDRPVWTGSCPCPSFSTAGKGKGFADPRHLWPHWIRLIRECRPTTIFGEQVSAAIGHGWLDVVYVDLEAAAYSVGPVVLGACSVGAPHIRQRLYFGAHAAGSRRQEAREHDGGQSLLPARSVEYGRTELCADSERDGGRTDEQKREAKGRAVDGRDCATGDRSDSDVRLPSHRDLQRSGEQRLLAEDSGTGECRESERPRLEGHFGDVRDWRGPGWLDPNTARSVAEAGATRGFWADCDWWHARDEKYRPIEPGVFPLAHGATNRVLKLRGYGDAICAEVAKAFIESFVEVSGLGS